jgi:hypothetical protein
MNIAWPLPVPALRALALWVGAEEPPALELEAGSAEALEQSDIAVLRVVGSEARLFYKCVDIARLRQRLEKPDAKWRTTARSFRNEAAFYAHADGAALRAAGVSVPLCVHAAVEDSGPSPELDIRFTLLLEYLSPRLWSQRDCFNELECAAALRQLARFHAHFWVTGDGDVAPTPAWWGGLFTPGGWWRRPLRPSVDYSCLPDVPRRLAAAFPDRLGGIDSADARAALTALRDGLDALTAALATPPYATLVHGDPKPSNWAFRRQVAMEDASDGAGLQAALFDFQWSGPARSGCADVAYLLLGGVQPDLMLPARPDGSSSSSIGRGEDALLRLYHAELTDALEARGVPPERRPTWERLSGLEYPLECLAYAATALAQLVAPLTPESLAANAGRYGFLTHEFDLGAVRLLIDKSVALVRTPAVAAVLGAGERSH